MPPTETEYTRLLGYESVDDVPFVSGTEALIITTYTGVVQTQVIGKKVPRLVFGYAERAIRTVTYTGLDKTKH